MRTTLLLLLFTAFAYSQQDCAVICHNGKLVKSVGAKAINGHLNHHVNDVLISTDCDYVITGNECKQLSVPKLDFKKRIKVGLAYKVSDIQGRILQKGFTDDYLFMNLPKGLIFVDVDEYQIKKMIK